MKSRKFFLNFLSIILLIVYQGCSDENESNLNKFVKVEIEQAGFKSIDRLLSIKIGNLNSEYKDKLKSTEINLQDKVDYHSTVDHTEYMIKELKELKL